MEIDIGATVWAPMHAGWSSATITAMHSDGTVQLLITPTNRRRDGTGIRKSMDPRRLLPRDPELKGADKPERSPSELEAWKTRIGEVA